MPPIHLTNVDLPAPLSPTRAVTSPAFAVKFTDDNTWTGPNDFSIPRSSSMGMVVMSYHLFSWAWGWRRVGANPTGSIGGHWVLMPLAVHSCASVAVEQTAAAGTQPSFTGRATFALVITVGSARYEGTSRPVVGSLVVVGAVGF